MVLFSAVVKSNCAGPPSMLALIACALIPEPSKRNVPLILDISGRPNLSFAYIVPLLIKYSPLYWVSIMLYSGISILIFSFAFPAVFKSSVKPKVTSLTGLLLIN